MCEKARAAGAAGVVVFKFASPSSRFRAQAAADAGEFNVSEWATNSSSVKGMLSWARRSSVNRWVP